MTLDANFIFSAHSLQDYVDCPRRFYLRYIRKISWPALPGDPILEIEENIQNGQQFHQLARQYFSGIRGELLLERTSVSPLREWLSTFLDFVSGLNIRKSYVEEALVAKINSRLIQARYDLIFQDKNGSIKILDWKTARMEPRKSGLRDRMQTIVYPFILAESVEKLFDDPPESKEMITMQFWYVNHPNINVEFPYSEMKHSENRAILAEIIDEIEQKDTGEYPKTGDKKLCRFCTYRSLCERGNIAGLLSESKGEIDLDDLVIDFDNLPDFELET